MNTAAAPIFIFNIYNDSDNSDCLQVNQDTLAVDAQYTRLINSFKMIGTGDFNQHHLLWDEDHNTHLFTTNNLDTTRSLSRF